MFGLGTRKIETNLPSQSAPTHFKRAVYQAGHIWGQALISVPDLPEPSEWGWQKTNDIWQPFWTHLPEASKGCRELKKC